MVSGNFFAYKTESINLYFLNVKASCLVPAATNMGCDVTQCSITYIIRLIWCFQWHLHWTCLCNKKCPRHSCPGRGWGMDSWDTRMGLGTELCVWGHLYIGGWM